jgi:hypothetical protein
VHSALFFSLFASILARLRISRKRIRLATILHDRFFGPPYGFMFLCYPRHHVLDTGLFMVFQARTAKLGAVWRFCPFDHCVTKQCSASGCCCLTLLAFDSGFYLYDCLFLRASPQEWLGGPLAPLIADDTFVAQCGEYQNVIPQRSRLQGPFFTSFRLRLEYPLIFAFRSSRL